MSLQLAYNFLILLQESVSPDSYVSRTPYMEIRWKVSVGEDFVLLASIVHKEPPLKSHVLKALISKSWWKLSYNTFKETLTCYGPQFQLLLLLFNNFAQYSQISLIRTSTMRIRTKILVPSLSSKILRNSNPFSNSKKRYLVPSRSK